jgi:excisionase family DNA binding protein
MENLLTTEEAAARLGVTGARVRAMIRDERLPAQKFGHVHMIKEVDLKLVENRKTGRPPKAKAEDAPATVTNGTRKRTTTKATAKKGGRK